MASHALGEHLALLLDGPELVFLALALYYVLQQLVEQLVAGLRGPLTQTCELDSDVVLARQHLLRLLTLKGLRFLLEAVLELSEWVRLWPPTSQDIDSPLSV